MPYLSRGNPSGGLGKRDFMLARLAEELLAVRLAESKLGQRQQWLQQAISQAPSADASWAFTSAREEVRPLLEATFTAATKNK
jgi:hypothetical protein